MEQLITVLAPLGTGGILAAFIFYTYIKQSRDHKAEMLKLSNDYISRLEHHINTNRNERNLLIGIVEKLTETVTTSNEINRNLLAEIRMLISIQGHK